MLLRAGDYGIGDRCVEALFWTDTAEILGELIVPEHDTFIPIHMMSDKIKTSGESDWVLDCDCLNNPTLSFNGIAYDLSSSVANKKTAMHAYQSIYEMALEIITGVRYQLSRHNIKIERPEEFNVLLHVNSNTDVCAAECVSIDDYVEYISRLNSLFTIDKLYVTMDDSNTDDVMEVASKLTVPYELISVPLHSLHSEIAEKITLTVTHSTGILHLSGLLNRYTVNLDPSNYEDGDMPLFWVSPAMKHHIAFGKGENNAPIDIEHAAKSTVQQIMCPKLYEIVQRIEDKQWEYFEDYYKLCLTV